MIGKELIEATRYLLWYGSKAIAGDQATEEEFKMMVEAREKTLPIAHTVMRISPDSYEYTPGQPFR